MSIEGKPKRGRGRPKKNSSKPPPQDVDLMKLNKFENDPIIFHFNIKYEELLKHSKLLSKEEIDDNSVSSINNFFRSSRKKSSEDNENCLEYKKRIEELEKQNEKLRETIKNNEETINKKNNKIVNNLVSNVDGTHIIIKPTKLKCWWCCHKFSDLPCVIPEKYTNGHYHVYGNFCSLNCMMAFNITELADYKVSERESLIKRMYDIDEDINPSPRRQILEKFGGPQSIENYRKNFVTYSVDYFIPLPPVNCVSIPIEYIDKKNYDLLFINNKTDLVRKRTKPLPNSEKNLFNSMGILVSSNR